MRVDLGGAALAGRRGHAGGGRRLHLVPGAEVWAAFKATDVEVYPV